MNKTVRIALLTIGGLIAATFLFFLIGFWPGSTKDVEAVADQFQPGEQWKLESERISPPQLICLQADCGEIRRVWVSDSSFREADEELRVVVDGFASVDVIKNNVACRKTTRNSYCEMSIHKDGFPTDISIESRGVSDRPTLIIQVNPKEK